MGVDEALLESAAAGGPASLRLYAWRGAWLSLGYRQALDEGRARRCAVAGVGVVRRSTGGRAVLHGADLTYAVAAPQALLPGGPAESYACIAAGLAEALRGLGVEVEERPLPAAAARGAEGFDCFAEPAAHELCAAGRKLVGSAQRRAHGAVLQHGSLRLDPDPAEAARATGLAGEEATSLRELGCRVAPEAVREALARGLARALGAELHPAGLLPGELAAASRRGPSPPKSHRRTPRGTPQGASAQTDRY
jgi:lipoate-protein ligase A